MLAISKFYSRNHASVLTFCGGNNVADWITTVRKIGLSVNYVAVVVREIKFPYDFPHFFVYPFMKRRFLDHEQKQRFEGDD
jgi:hypothetical protein